MSREANVGALPLPLQFMAAWVGAWLGRHQARTIEYLRAENRALREQLGGRRIRLTDAQRRRLAELGKAVGRKGLGEVATVASPDTILKWYRELVGRRHLLLDRDPLYTKEFRAALKQGGVTVIRLPPRSPYAERFVLSIRSECLDRIVPMGEAHLRLVVREHMDHDHHERNHQGLANAPIVPMTAEPANGNGVVCRRERLGGLLNFYTRRAA